MAKLIDEFWLIWRRTFSDQFPPSLRVVSFLESNRSSGDILQAMEDDLSFLKSRKSQLEDQLDQIEFCLSWINEQKESIQADYLQKVTEKTMTFTRSGNEKQEQEHVNHIDKGPARQRKRSSSMSELSMLKAFQISPRRGSDISDSMAGIINMPDYINVPIRPSPPPNWPLPDTPVARAASLPASNPAQRRKQPILGPIDLSQRSSSLRTSLDIHPVKESSPSDHVSDSNKDERDQILESDIISFLCKEMTPDEAWVVARSIKGNNVKSKAIKNKDYLRQLMQEYVSVHTLDSLLMVLYENRLYDLHGRAREKQNDESFYVYSKDVQPNQTDLNRRSDSGGSRNLKLIPSLGFLRSPRSPAPECPPEGMNQTPPSNHFQFGVIVTKDLFPKDGTDLVPGQYRKLVLLRGQKMDVIGFYQQGTRLRSYIARNSEGEIGLVPKEYCQKTPEADPIIWQREWYAKPKSEKTAKERIHDAPVGSFFIRDCQQKPGSLTLTVKLDGQIGKFIIEVDKSSYFMENSSENVFGSLDQLINYYQHNTLQSGKEVFLTKPSEH